MEKVTLKRLILLVYCIVFVVCRFILGIRGIGYLWAQCLVYVIAGTAVVFAYYESLANGVREWINHPAKNGAWMIGIFIANLVLSNLALFPISLFCPDYVSGQENSIYTAFTDTNVPAILLVVALGVFGPILEEAVFRLNMIGDAPKSCLPWVFVVISAIIFMGMHMTALSVPELLNALPQFVTGILYGVGYKVTRNSTVPIGLHIFNNLPAMLMIAISI